jgi:hypothetical protein
MRAVSIAISGEYGYNPRGVGVELLVSFVDILNISTKLKEE